MNTEILLDYEGDLPTPPDVQVITSEVEFLCHALGDQPLLIRGERLCAWAEAFYSLREQPFKHLASPATALRHIYPALSSDNSKKLARKIALDTVFTEELSDVFILTHCYPDDYALWQGEPSPEHAARWLLWLYEHQPDKAEVVILEHFASGLERQAADAPEAAIYRAVNREEAKSLLWRWLGAAQENLAGLSAFPLDIPGKLLKEIKTEWMKRIIATQGRLFPQTLVLPLTLAVRQELAMVAAEFYLEKENLHHLTREVLRQLHPYLNIQTLARLEESLPPPEPAPLPGEEDDVLDWFQFEYMPYRRWQARFGDERARKTVIQQAQAFAQWYLLHYPRWLLDGKRLSFQKSAELPNMAPQALTLCIILDGLPAWDAEDFVQAVSSKVERLALQQKSYCFAPLPTVTEFAKDALLKGVPPRLAPQSPPLGSILPDNISPKSGLKDARPGEVIFWRVAQPDTAYHFEHGDKREREVRAKLESILQAIQEVVKNLPDRIPLHILITSDHGRLMNPKSPCRLPVPPAMQAHGRVAWGRHEHAFDESGFVINKQAGWVEIYGERFEMLYDMRIAWGEESFQNNKGSHEPYPHGGLFPEEAIVPWFDFERDAEPLNLDITISGSGESGNIGSLLLNIINPSPMILECPLISLSNGAQVNGKWRIAPRDVTRFSVPLNPWPSKADLFDLKAILLFLQPNGVTLIHEVIPTLEAKSLYERDESLLKDLGL
jgi:hypothetical protein